MQLSIQSLKKQGVFTGAPVEREIKWEQNGEEHSGTVFVRKMSFHTAVSDIVSRGKEGVARRIATHICDEKGDPLYTEADITGESDPELGAFSYELTMALLSAIGEVNGLGKQKKPTSKK